VDWREVIRSRRGVRFQCHACGHCCSGESEGLVFIYDEEIRAISTHLKMSETDFLYTYCDVVEAAYKGEYVPTIVIKMNPNTNNCIFQQANDSCIIYPVRPFQCRSFPFWTLNVENAITWEKLKEICPGFSRSKGGHLYTLDEIQALLDKEKLLEDEHYRRLLENDFKLSALYPCLEKKETASNVTKSLDQQHTGTISRHPRASTAGDSPDTRGD
jgi:Fe-S-cluster containining protein